MQLSSLNSKTEVQAMKPVKGLGFTDLEFEGLRVYGFRGFSVP